MKASMNRSFLTVAIQNRSWNTNLNHLKAQVDQSVFGGSLNWLFAALALGLIVYGVALTAAITSGAWFGRERTINARG